MTTALQDCAVAAALVLFANGAGAQTMQSLGDLRPGAVGSIPSLVQQVTSHGRYTFFSAEDNHGVEPWRTDGTAAGTVRLADLHPGGWSSAPADYTGFGALVVFRADSPLGRELAVSDGSPAGTQVLVDIRPGPASSDPRNFVVFRDEVLFLANDAAGTRTWRTDGTVAGTFPHPVLSGDALRVAGDKLYFVQSNGAHHQLRCWDGSAAPSLVAAFVGTNPPSLVAEFQRRLVFLPTTGSFALTAAWATDGTPAGTVPITAPAVDFADFTASFDQLAYVVTGIGSRDLRVTDGSLAGDRLLTGVVGTLRIVGANASRWFCNIASSSFPPFTLNSLVSIRRDGSAFTLLGPTAHGAVDFGERLAYGASDAAHGKELWVSDGTTVGTGMVLDVLPGPASAFGSNMMTHHGAGRVVMWANDGSHGAEPFVVHLGAGTRAVGAGCSAGIAPELATTDPVLGGSVGFHGRTVQPSAPGLVAIGPPATLPWFAVPGCAVHVDAAAAPILVPFTTDAAGVFAPPPIPVPNAAWLDGLVLVGQAVLPLQLAPLWGLALSNAVELTLGT